MIIKFSPQIRDSITEFVKIGNNLTVDGELLDLDSIPNGSTVPSEAIDVNSVNSIIKDISGNITIELVWTYSDSNDWISSWPADLIDPIDGIIAPIESTKPEPEVPPGETS